MSTVVETLDPTIKEPVSIELTLSDGKKVVFTQRPLSFFGKMELFSVLGDAVSEALSGENAMTLKGLLDVPERDGEAPLSARDFLDADSFVKAIAKLTQVAPDLLKDIFCISLAIPRQARPYVKEVMDEQIDDDEGFALLEGFIDQNWEVLKGFFSEKIMPLIDKMMPQAQDSAPSKQSKATRRRTQKQ